MAIAITSDIEVVLGVLTLIGSTLLGFMVYFNNKKSSTNRLFFLLSIFIDLYIIVNFVSLHPPINTPEVQLFWIRVVMLVCSFIGPILFLLVHTFPHQHLRLRFRYILGLFTLMTLSAIASITPLVFKAIEYPGGKPVPVPGPGIPIFFLDFVGLFIVSIITLIVKYRRAVGEEKGKLLSFLVGVLVSFSLMGICTVTFVVILKTSAMVFLGPIFPVVLIGCIAYSIVKHKMFDVKVFSTQILMAVIAIVLFSKIFMAQSVTAQIVDMVLFLLVAVIGIILVKSVRREVEQREELATLAQTLEKANLRLQELDRQKTEFLSIASHQLRTPLSIIKGYIELIEDGVYGKMPKKVEAVLSDMDESNERLVKLVDEFLDISRIEQERTKFNFEKCDISETVQSVLKELSQKAEGKGLILSEPTYPKSHEVTMDEEKVRHVIFNFVDNALKYSDKGSVDVKVTTEKGGFAVRVQDQGFGFNKEDEANFFQKFYRGKNVVGTNVNGTGLGIYVCKKFIEAHGGNVWAHSPGLGKGSEFGFWIPAVPVDKPAPKEETLKQTAVLQGAQVE
jgi:signal transduction histidine kinase